MPDDIVTINIKGTKEAAKALRLAADQGLKDDFKARMKEAAEVVASAARSTVPVVTGALQGTIRTGTTTKSAVVRAGSTKLVYAPIISFGWPKRNIEANDFLMRALDSTSGQVGKILDDAIDKVVDGINSND